MKILAVSYSDSLGGAAKAMVRIVTHLCAAGHQAQLLVARRDGQESFVRCPYGPLQHAWAGARRRLARAVIISATRSASPDRSLGLLSGGLIKDINASDADVVMLGWVGEETLSVKEISQIRKPLVWRFSDMWPLTGTEHYVDAAAFERYTVTGAHRMAWRGDLDASIFRGKQRLRSLRPTVISPSRWLAQCVRSSVTAHDWPVHCIPTPVDTNVFRPDEARRARAELGIDPATKVLLFSAMGAADDPRKGADLLMKALSALDPDHHLCLLVGASGKAVGWPVSVPVISVGTVTDESRLAALYGAADVCVIPSRIDNLPQAGLEAQSCGCPVVVFDTSGLSELVDDGITGLRVPAFSIHALAAALRALLDDDVRRADFSRAARQRALASWQPALVIPQYVEVLAHTQRRFEGLAEQ